jgi:CheY-like chemotaxis protein
VALILVVEDNETNADMLSRRLKRAGHTVLVATDGEAGVELARQHRPDLVLMDLGLPIMDGWTAARAIKADASIAHIPVMALTAHAVVGEREKALEAGCDDYDTKPVEWTRLKTKIAVLLDAAERTRLENSRGRSDMQHPDGQNSHHR